ncbi:MAG TPA: hypothetical protein VMG12_18695 [Polyangiaceae bacterium]|nr:hypothetical protein [Polyangiaceae bacterium]
MACGADDRPARLGGNAASESAGRGGSSGAAASASGEGGEGGAAGSATAGAGAAGEGGGAADPQGPGCVPRESCQRLCSVFGNDPSGCGLGNPEQCGCACEERFNGPCPDELDALLACAGETPSIDCRARGRIFEGCEDASFALEACDFQARDQLCAGAYPACTPYCRGAMLAFCPLGPESVASCLCGCEASLVTTCASEFDAFMACTAQAPTFSCDIAGRIVASSCANEWSALAVCIGVPVNGGEK